MVRGLMVVLTFVAIAARAQGAKAAASEVPPPIVLVSRSTPEPHPPSLVRGTASPDAGADAGTARASTFAADCSITEAFLHAIDVAVRTYQPPKLAPAGEGAWKQTPYVAAAARCGPRYTFQVQSQSQKAWVIDRARVEGPNEELLSVAVPLFNQVEAIWDINVISVQVPPGAKLSKLTLHLTSQDGRVAQVEAEDLP